MPPHPGETLGHCKAKPGRLVLPKTPCHPPWPGSNLQGVQQRSCVQQWCGSHLRTDFPPCFMVILSDCLLLQLENCFLSIPGCFWSPLHCELCWQSSLGQINGRGTALTFVPWNPQINSLHCNKPVPNEHWGVLAFCCCYCCLCWGLFIVMWVIPSLFVLFLWLKNLFLTMLLWFSMNFVKKRSEGKW